MMSLTLLILLPLACLALIGMSLFGVVVVAMVMKQLKKTE